MQLLLSLCSPAQLVIYDGGKTPPPSPEELYGICLDEARRAVRGRAPYIRQDCDDYAHDLYIDLLHWLPSVAHLDIRQGLIRRKARRLLATYIVRTTSIIERPRKIGSGGWEPIIPIGGLPDHDTQVRKPPRVETKAVQDLPPLPYCASEDTGESYEYWRERLCINELDKRIYDLLAADVAKKEIASQLGITANCITKAIADFAARKSQAA